MLPLPVLRRRRGRLLELCVAASAGAARGWEGGRGLRAARGRCGLGPARTMQGEGCRKGVCSRRGGLSAFPLPSLPHATFSRLFGLGALGVSLRAVGPPSSWVPKGGRSRADPEKRASWKWAKRKKWVYENNRGNSRGPECVREKLAVDRCGYGRNSDLGSTC